MTEENFIEAILANMEYVSPEANPNDYNIEGKTTIRKFFEKFRPDMTDLKDIWDEYFCDYVEDEMTFEDFSKYALNDLEINFWVYDRYNDGSFIMYTLYGDDDSNFGTYEILTYEIFDL